jgi:hypothetical protein
VAATTFAGQEVIRICATHGEISAADVRELVATLGATRAEAAASPPGPAAT